MLAKTEILIISFMILIKTTEENKDAKIECEHINILMQEQENIDTNKTHTKQNTNKTFNTPNVYQSGSGMSKEQRNTDLNRSTTNVSENTHSFHYQFKFCNLTTCRSENELQFLVSIKNLIILLRSTRKIYKNFFSLKTIDIDKLAKQLKLTNKEKNYLITTMYRLFNNINYMQHLLSEFFLMAKTFPFFDLNSNKHVLKRNYNMIIHKAIEHFRAIELFLRRPTYHKINRGYKSNINVLKRLYLQIFSDSSFLF